MTASIEILPDHVINKIAAGEVVERPASVVKELIENSLDAGATDISIAIQKAGNRLIRIVDNGSGMSGEDARMAFERHATSKIRSDADLEAIRTMGFRGEALSSIASVAHIRLLTAEHGSPSGTMIETEGGVVKSVSEAAASQGTSIEVEHLFFNTPARLKFLKSPSTEVSHILIAVSRQAMAHPDVRFRLTHDNKPLLDLPPASSAQERVFQLYGSEIADQVFAFSGGPDNVHVYGLVARPAYTRADRTYQDFYVNGRAIRNASLTHALYSAFDTLLMRDRHPVGFVFIDIDPALVDVNVHPAKAEVRFRNQTQVHDLVRDVIREGLRHDGLSFPAGADTVKEAVSEYLQNAEFGMRNAEFKDRYLLPESESTGGFSETSEMPIFGFVPSTSYSEFRIPNSALFPLAQVHDSYIIAQSREGMALIDQHAAHERVLFEKLQDQYSQGNVSVQNLLIPAQVELGAAQSNLLAEHLPELSKLGFIVEDFAHGAFVIKAVPSLLVGADYTKLLLDILDELNVHGRSGTLDKLRDEIFCVMACHPAIKIHRQLDRKEMETLINDLFQCRMPHSCPHGRPTITRFSLDEIKKMFKRT